MDVLETVVARVYFEPMDVVPLLGLVPGTYRFTSLNNNVYLHHKNHAVADPSTLGRGQSQWHTGKPANGARPDLVLAQGDFLYMNCLPPWGNTSTEISAIVFITRMS